MNSYQMKLLKRMKQTESYNLNADIQDYSLKLNEDLWNILLTLKV